MKPTFILKRSYAQALAVFLAVIVSYFYSFSEKYWMVLSALVVMQAAINVPVRQGMQQLLIFLLVVVVGTYVSSFASFFQCLLLGVAVICLATFFEVKAWIFAIIFFIALLPTSYAIQARINDIGIGGAIGILTNLFIFPARADVQFRNSVIYFVKLYSRYLSAIDDYLLQKETSKELVLKNKIELESVLQNDSTEFPSWVYQAGLSATLRPGHRHFLIMTERLSEILASMHRIARHPFSQEIVKRLEEPLTHFVREAQKILAAMSAVLALNKMDQPVSDLKEEWIAIEKTINDLIPVTFDISDQEPVYFRLISLLEDLNDLRHTLINLGNSLQTACSKLGI